METLPAREVRVPLDAGVVLGDLVQPPGSHALVLFVNERGCGRHCLQDRYVARALYARGIGSLLIDVLTPDEQQERPHPGWHGADLPCLTQRMLEVVTWLQSQPDLRATGLALCGLTLGGPAALIVAGRLGAQVQAVVAIGGQGDLAGPTALAAIRAPTLLLAGSRDPESLAHNEVAYQQLRCERSLAVLPGGTRQVDEPQGLACAAEMAANWFVAHVAHAAHVAHVAPVAALEETA